MQSINDIQPTPKELYLEWFFEDSNIKFVRQVKKEGLKGDSKSFRVVDYYLPKLDVYVEYLGMWHQGENHKKDIREKINVYLKNRLPTVFIYPEEIGSLEWTFHYKLVKLLSHKSFLKSHKGKLIKFRLSSFLSENFSRFFLVIFLFFVSFMILYDIGSLFIWIAIISSAFGIEGIYTLIKDFIEHKNDYGIRT